MSVLYKVLSSMEIEMQRQESIARNLAGVQIPGFKGETVVSSDFDGLVDQYSESGQGTLMGGKVVSHNPGSLKHTDRPLDFALAGEGFFELTTPKGETVYTRNGRFTLSPSGEIQTGDGFLLTASRGDLTLNEEDSLSTLHLREDGFLMVGTGSNKRELGQIKVVKVEDLEKLKRISSSYYQLEKQDEKLAREMDVGEFKLTGRSIETANISAVKEMITMIDSMRKYEMAQRLMKMRDGIKTKEFSTFGS